MIIEKCKTERKLFKRKNGRKNARSLHQSETKKKLGHYQKPVFWKDTTGSIIANEERGITRWTEYFRQLINQSKQFSFSRRRRHMKANVQPLALNDAPDIVRLIIISWLRWCGHVQWMSSCRVPIKRFEVEYIQQDDYFYIRLHYILNKTLHNNLKIVKIVMWIVRGHLSLHHPPPRKNDEFDLFIGCSEKFQS